MVGVQEARAVAGKSAGTLVAAMTAAFAAGQVLGPMVVAALGQGFGTVLVLAAALLVASAVALAWR